MSGTGTLTLSDTGGSAVTLNIGANNATTTFSGAIGGLGGLTKVGTGMLTLGNSGTYTGQTTLTGGTLLLANKLTLQESTLNASGAGILSFGTLTAATFGGLSGSNPLALNNFSLAGVTLRAGSNNASTAYSGQLSGLGSLIKVGSGTLTLAGASYTGTTTINRGVLQANDGAGLPAGNLALSGGVLQSNFAAVTFNRSLGTGSGNVQWTGSGGFSATGGPLTVNLSGVPNPLVWGGTGGTQYFLSAGTALVFGSPTANNQVVFQNNINLNGAAQTISVTAGLGGDSALVSGVLSGAGSLSKTGSGLLILAASNTYTGTTTVSAGSLQLGTGLVNGSVQGNITDTAALIFNNAANQTYAGVISGSAGTVTDLGSAMLTLTASNTYTGNTTIGGGTLNLNYSLAGSTTGNILPSGSAATTSFTGGTLLLTGSSGASQTQTLGMFAFNAGGSAITLAPHGGTLALALAGSGTWNRATGAAVNFSLPTNATITAGTAGTVVNGILAASTGTPTAYATINGSDWATVSGTQIAALPSYTGAFGSGANIDMALTGGTWAGGTANTLAFRSSTVPTLTLSGPATLQAGGILVGSGVGATPTQITGGSLISLTNEVVVQQFNTAAPLTINSPINNNGATSLTKAGPGTVILNGGGNFSGGVLVDAGTLQLGGPSAPPINTNNTITTSGGGIFDLNGASPTVAMLAGSSGSIINSASTAATLNVTVGNANDGAYGGLLAGSGTLNLMINFSAGSYSQFALNCAVPNTFMGNIIVNGTGNSDGADGHGVLGLRSDGVLGAPGNGITLNNGGTLFNGYSPAGASGWTAGLNADPNLSASRTITLGTGAGGVFRVWSSTNFTVNSLITGYGNFTKADLGTLILINSGNNWSGATALTNGTLILGASNALPIGASLTLGTPSSGNVATLDLGGFSQTIGSLATTGTATASQTIGNSSTTSDSTLTYNGAGGNSTFGGIIEDAIGPGTHKTNLTVSGGMLTLNNASGYTYTGPTVVNGGTLALASGTSDRAGSTLASAAITVNPGGTLYLASFGQLGWTNNSSITLNGGTLGMSDGQYNYVKTITMSSGATWALGTGHLVNGLAGANFGLTTLNSQGSGNTTNIITSRGGAISAAGGVTFNVALGTAPVDLSVNAALTDYNGTPGSITKTGAGTMLLAMADPYSGGTTISGGALVVANNGGLGSGGVTMNPATAATIEFTSAAPTIGGSLSSSGVGTSSIVLGNSASNTPTTLTVGNNANSTFDGAIGDLSATAPAAVGNLVKTGTGTLTLGGSNTYTGSTTIGGAHCNLISANLAPPPPIFSTPAPASS